MLAPFGTLISENEARGLATPAFTCYDVSTAAGVLAAAEERGAGAILLLAPSSFRAPGGDLLLAALVAAAEAAGAPACVELDHAPDLGLIERALGAGAGAVLADGSKLAYEDNVALVAAAVSLAAAHGAEVEAELGHVAGDEDVAVAAQRGALTDPDQATAFVEATGASCLAVSIGNVHGRYAAPPALDWDRLARIDATVRAPLALHGASGLAADDLRVAVARGIRKVNVNTEIRERQFAALNDRLDEWTPGASMLDLNGALRDAATAVARATLLFLEIRA